MSSSKTLKRSYSRSNVSSGNYTSSSVDIDKCLSDLADIIDELDEAFEEVEATENVEVCSRAEESARNLLATIGMLRNALRAIHTSDELSKEDALDIESTTRNQCSAQQDHLVNLQRENTVTVMGKNQQVSQKPFQGQFGDKMQKQ